MKAPSFQKCCLSFVKLQKIAIVTMYSSIQHSTLRFGNLDDVSLIYICGEIIFERASIFTFLQDIYLKHSLDVKIDLHKCTSNKEGCNRSRDLQWTQQS